MLSFLHVCNHRANRKESVSIHSIIAEHVMFTYSFHQKDLHDINQDIVKHALIANKC